MSYVDCLKLYVFVLLVDVTLLVKCLLLNDVVFRSSRIEICLCFFSFNVGKKERNIDSRLDLIFD